MNVLFTNAAEMKHETIHVGNMAMQAGIFSLYSNGIK